MPQQLSAAALPRDNLHETSSPPCPYAGERHRSDSEPGGDVVLRHPTDDFRAGPQQFLVTLLRRVPDARQEELLVTVEAVDQFLLISTLSQGLCSMSR